MPTPVITRIKRRHHHTLEIPRCGAGQHPETLDTMRASDNEGATKEAYYTCSRSLEPAWIRPLVA